MDSGLSKGLSGSAVRLVGGLEMSDVMVDVSDLKSIKGKKLEDLKAFLEEKLEASVSEEGNKLVLGFEEEAAKRSLVRGVLRRFLHKSGLKDDLRVISGEDGTFVYKKVKKRLE